MEKSNDAKITLHYDRFIVLANAEQDTFRLVYVSWNERYIRPFFYLREEEGE